ncbi:MAG: hypothetical protein KDI15_13705 [Thiothrix sp.]|nr:hypothetical protein [Thiothrix sp.]
MPKYTLRPACACIHLKDKSNHGSIIDKAGFTHWPFSPHTQTVTHMVAPAKCRELLKSLWRQTPPPATGGFFVPVFWLSGSFVPGIAGNTTPPAAGTNAALSTRALEVPGNFAQLLKPTMESQQ